MKNFEIKYRVIVSEGEEIDQKVSDICLQESVELPQRLLSGVTEAKVVGRSSQPKQIKENVYEVNVAWPLKNIGGDISEFLNILYGNISLQSGIKITGAQWDALNGELFGGPAYGINKIRKKFGKPKRALSSTSLRPLETYSEGIAALAYEFAAGGLDLVKDDHGIANKEDTPFEERVKACVAAIQQAADETGNRAHYFPHITSLAADTIERYKQAAELGADGVLICPHISGMETMHQLAQMDIDLPIIAHPAFSESLTTNEKQGLSPSFLYGELWRALGADFVVYPNNDGQLSLSLEEYQAINESARTTGLPFESAFPIVGGSMKPSDISDWLESYGPDTVILLGADLYDHPDGLRKAAEGVSGMLK